MWRRYLNLLAALCLLGCGEGPAGFSSQGAASSVGADGGETGGGPMSSGGSNGGRMASAGGQQTNTGGAPGGSAAIDAGADANPCGNGDIDPGEQCDGDNHDGQTCATSSSGRCPGGFLLCTDQCIFRYYCECGTGGSSP